MKNGLARINPGSVAIEAARIVWPWQIWHFAVVVVFSPGAFDQLTS
jgi:hypothetical protein